MELLDEGFELFPQRDEKRNYHSLKSSYVPKGCAGPFVISLDPWYDPVKHGLSSPFDRWRNKGSQKLSKWVYNPHDCKQPSKDLNSVQPIWLLSPSSFYLAMLLLRKATLQALTIWAKGEGHQMSGSIWQLRADGNKCQTISGGLGSIQTICLKVWRFQS